MERKYITLEDFKNMNLVSNTTSLVCSKDDMMYKIFNPQKVVKETEEKRVKAAESLNLYHIERPKELLYMNDKFIGFSSPRIEGISLDKYLYDVLPSGSYYNLELLAYIFKDLETIIDKANKEGIVIPDLGSINNILVTKKGLYYVDYSGLQIKDIRSSDISTILVNNSWSDIFYCNKYFDQDLLFTKELDKVSIIYMFFYLAFRISLKDYNFEDAVVLIDTFKNVFKIDDPILMHKVWLLYQKNLPNEFIADYLNKLSYNYKIVTDYKNAKRMLVRK